LKSINCDEKIELSLPGANLGAVEMELDRLKGFLRVGSLTSAATVREVGCLVQAGPRLHAFAVLYDARSSIDGHAAGNGSGLGHPLSPSGILINILNFSPV
jgi:hypothetical protein